MVQGRRTIFGGENFIINALVKIVWNIKYLNLNCLKNIFSNTGVAVPRELDKNKTKYTRTPEVHLYIDSPAKM